MLGLGAFLSSGMGTCMRSMAMLVPSVLIFAQKLGSFMGVKWFISLGGAFGVVLL